MKRGKVSKRYTNAYLRRGILQSKENLWVHMYFFVFFFLLAVKRCPHVLTMNAHTDSIVLS